MVGGRADAERLAIPELSADIRSYVNHMRQGQETVERRLLAAGATVRRALSESRRQLTAAMERLDACRRVEDADCTGLAAAVQRARAHLESTYTVAAEIEGLDSQYRPAARRFATALETINQGIQRDLDRAGSTLDVYLGQSRGAPGGSPDGGAAGRARAPSSGATSGVSLSRPTGFPADVYLVPLSLIDDSDTRIHGPGDFSEFYSPADLEWAHEAFVGVVMPGVAAGATVDTFRSRDQQEGRMGVRSYAMVYSGFFGTDAIKLSGAGAKLEVNNGYHRIWVARRMGLDAVPARVSGRGLA